MLELSASKFYVIFMKLFICIHELSLARDKIRTGWTVTNNACKQVASSSEIKSNASKYWVLPFHTYMLKMPLTK